jgi:hypothetical protein
MNIMILIERVKLFAFSLVVLFLLFFTECLSVDLSDYPDFLFNDIYVVVGADASVLDLAAATDILANIKSNYPTVNIETKLDNELVNPFSVYRNLILVGNACENKFVAMIMVKAFPSCNSALGIPENSAIIKIYEDGFVHGYDVLLVAGWNGTYTRIAASVLQKHSQLLSGMSEKAVKITSATLSGITPFSEEEFVTTIQTSTSTSSSTSTLYQTTSVSQTNENSTIVTTLPTSNEIGIPKSFYVYSLIIVVLIVGISLIVMICSRK